MKNFNFKRIFVILQAMISETPRDTPISAIPGDSSNETQSGASSASPSINNMAPTDTPLPIANSALRRRRIRSVNANVFVIQYM